MSSLNLISPVDQGQILDLRQSQYPSSFRKGARFVWFRTGSLMVADAAAIVGAWLGAMAVLTPQVSG
jgi:hypothetical protein